MIFIIFLGRFSEILVGKYEVDNNGEFECCRQLKDLHTKHIAAILAGW